MSVLSPFYAGFADTKFFSVLPCSTKGAAHTFQNINHNSLATDSILRHYTHGNISPRVSHNCFPFLLQPYQKKKENLQKSLRLHPLKGEQKIRMTSRNTHTPSVCFSIFVKLRSKCPGTSHYKGTSLKYTGEAFMAGQIPNFSFQSFSQGQKSSSRLIYKHQEKETFHILKI